MLTELNLKSRESDRVRENVNPLPADEEASPLLSPAPAGVHTVHTKVATIINPATKKALFTVVDRFFITIEIVMVL